MMDFPVIDIPQSQCGNAQAAVAFLLDQASETATFSEQEKAELLQLIFRREELGSTRVYSDTCIPHCRSPLLSSVMGIIGRCREPVAWPDRSSTETVRLVCLFIGQENIHNLRVFEALARQLRDLH